MEIAIKVLRQAGYHSHAVFLAEKHMHHEWYLKIQLEDIKVKTCKKMKFSCSPGMQLLESVKKFMSCFHAMCRITRKGCGTLDVFLLNKPRAT